MIKIDDYWGNKWQVVQVFSKTEQSLFKLREAIADFQEQGFKTKTFGIVLYVMQIRKNI